MRVRSILAGVLLAAASAFAADPAPPSPVAPPPVAPTTVPPPPAPPPAATTPAPTTPVATKGADQAPELPVERFQLENGLEVLLSRDTRVPLVAVNIWYHVGAKNEVPGRSGFAHLFEHIMFQGSRNVAEDTFFRYLEGAGAPMVNGTTDFDRTNYFETVPRDQLDLVLWIESDRMGYLLDVLDQELLDVQRDVVKNERRQSYDNAPYGPTI